MVAGTHTLFTGIDGLYANGAAVVGQRGNFIISNSTASVGGSLTVSNLGAILIFSNGFLNVGGTNQALANASTSTLTNLSGGVIQLGSAGGVPSGLQPALSTPPRRSSAWLTTARSELSPGRTMSRGLSTRSS